MRTYITAFMLAATLALVSCGGGNDVASSGASAVSAAAPSTPTTEAKVNGQIDERTGVAPVVAHVTIAPSVSNGNTARQVKIVNNSQAAHICIFQTSQGTPSLASLVWMSSYAVPGNTYMSWDENTYSFNFGWSNSVLPGAFFNSAGSARVDSMSSQNQINFDCSYMGCSLGSQTNGQAGSLIITETSSIPLSQYAVGFGMSDIPALIVQASPNQTVRLIGAPTYWISASPKCRDGQGVVLDSATVSTGTKLLFPAGVFSLTATLNNGGSWSISSGSSPF